MSDVLGLACRKTSFSRFRHLRFRSPLVVSPTHVARRISPMLYVLRLVNGSEPVRG
jgi:hypothetical protein